MKNYLIILILIITVLSCKNSQNNKGENMDNYKGFNITKLKTYSIEKISLFLKDHNEEVFYSFAIDDGLLCFNSISEFDITLKEYQSKYPEDYKTKENIDGLKYNTGDWSYQGFANLQDSSSFNKKLYDKFYDMGFNGAEESILKKTDYYLAMEYLLELIQKEDIFKAIKKTKDFNTFIVFGND